MARFGFVVFDKEKSKQRRGKLTATDLASAREQLFAKGYEIESLEPVAESDSSSGLRFKESSNRRLKADTPDYVFRPTLIHRLRSLWPSRNAVGWWIVLGSTFSLVVFCLSLESERSEHVSKNRSTSAALYKPVTLAIKGNVPASQSSDERLLTLSLPEIPYSKSWSIPNTPPGKTLEFESKRVPTYATLTLRSGKTVTREARISLTSPLTVDLDLIGSAKGR